MAATSVSIKDILSRSAAAWFTPHGRAMRILKTRATGLSDSVSAEAIRNEELLSLGEPRVVREIEVLPESPNARPPLGTIPQLHDQTCFAWTAWMGSRIETHRSAAASARAMLAGMSTIGCTSAPVELMAGWSLVLPEPRSSNISTSASATKPPRTIVCRVRSGVVGGVEASRGRRFVYPECLALERAWRSSGNPLSPLHARSSTYKTPPNSERLSKICAANRPL